MAGEEPDTAVLTGIRIIDFGQYIAGPLAAMLLADQGAEVIRIDPPGGPRFDSPANAVFNRGKKSIVLDLKNEEDVATARQLILAADVVIENFRPGVMDRLGLSPARMTKENPGLIYLSLPGFASSDPERSAVQAWEGIIGSATGLYTDINIMKSVLGLPPVYTALPLPSIYGAVHGALSVTMALIARERDGLGDIVEVPLASAVMSAMGGILFHVAKQPVRYDIPPVPRVISRVVLPVVGGLLATCWDKARESVYQFSQKAIPALMNSYRCADGRLLYVFAMDHARLPSHLLQEMGLLEGLRRQGLIETNPYESGVNTSNLRDASTLSRRWQRKIKGQLASAFQSKSAVDWESQLNSAGVPCSVQRTTAEWLDLAHLYEAGLAVEIEDPQYGSMRQPGVQTWVESTAKTHLQPKPAPKPDADRDEILASLHPLQKPSGASASPARAPAGDPILQGVRVLDLSNMVAGPACARTLAEYGADVIKIDSPRPLHGPRNTCWYGIEVGQGKRSVLIDLKSLEGRELFWRLLDSADVLVHNFRRGVAGRLGIGYARAKKRSPKIVYCNINAYDGPQDGPWADRPGYDPVLQAASGIMRRFGNSGQPELHAIASCVDYLTGYSAAFGIALALLKRRRTGSNQGEFVKTSLAQGAQLVQATFMYNFAGRVWDEPSGQSAIGDHALHRLYRARNGWLFLGATPSQIQAMSEIPALAGLDKLALEKGSGFIGIDSELSRFLERRLRKKNVRYWVRQFVSAGVGAHAVETISRIRRSAVVLRRMGEDIDPGGKSIVVVRQNHSAGGTVDTVVPAYARLTRSPLRLCDPAPRPGSDTREVLLEAGVNRKDLEELLENGSVAEEWSSEYLPS